MLTPPLDGAVNATVSLPLPTATVGCAGAAGAPCGMTEFEGGDEGPGPSALVAAAVHTYELPFDNSPTTIGDADPAAAPTTPPFEDAHATSKPVIGLPPSAGTPK